MPPLEQLFLLEVEFHRRLRSEANEPLDSGGLHTSYALQAGYETLLRSVGIVAAADIEALARKLALAGLNGGVIVQRPAGEKCSA